MAAKWIGAWPGSKQKIHEKSRLQAHPTFPKHD